MEQTLLLLRFNCPSPECDYMAEDWPHLERHTLSAHGKVICRVCRSQLSRFAHEQTLYPPHLLPLHDPTKMRGSRPPKPKGEAEIEMVKSWDAPHPVCEVGSVVRKQFKQVLKTVLPYCLLRPGRAVCAHAEIA